MAAREKRKLMIVDDSVVIQRLVQARMRADGFEVICINTGKDIVQVCQQTSPDVIILDIDMPEVTGFEACKMLKDDSTTSQIPVIFLSSKTSTDEKVKGLDIGAIDYVTKPFDPVELRARVRSAYRTKYLLELLEQKARVDGLTGLYNRAFFNDRIEEELDRARRYNGSLGLILFDVDRFKRVNDTYGHSFGDIVLAEVAETARFHARQSDVVARYGGEEFVIILPEQCSVNASHLAERIRAGIQDLKLHHNGGLVPVSASFGVSSTVEFGYDSSKELVDAADKMLYAAKEGGRNQVRVATKDLCTA
jgi:diguanylate cyclase (GGDEF)-like protein